MDQRAMGGQESRARQATAPPLQHYTHRGYRRARDSPRTSSAGTPPQAMGVWGCAARLPAGRAAGRCAVLAVILLGIVPGLLANEFCEFSPWCARKLVRWSAFRRYTDPGRAAMRAEELTALIDDRPGNLFKLFTAACFAADAVIATARRAVAREPAAAVPAPVLPCMRLIWSLHRGPGPHLRLPGRRAGRLRLLEGAPAPRRVRALPARVWPGRCSQAHSGQALRLRPAVRGAARQRSRPDPRDTRLLDLMRRPTGAGCVALGTRATTPQ